MHEGLVVANQSSLDLFSPQAGHMDKLRALAAHAPPNSDSLAIKEALRVGVISSGDLL